MPLEVVKDNGNRQGVFPSQHEHICISSLGFPIILSLPPSQMHTLSKILFVEKLNFVEYIQKLMKQYF